MNKFEPKSTIKTRTPEQIKKIEELETEYKMTEAEVKQELDRKYLIKIENAERLMTGLEIFKMMSQSIADGVNASQQIEGEAELSMEELNLLEENNPWKIAQHLRNFRASLKKR